MLRKIIYGVLIGTLAMGSAHATETVYTWKDAKGQVHFTDRPRAPSDAKEVNVYVRDSGGGEESPPESAGTNSSTSYPSDEPAASGGTVASVQADVAKARAENCKKAQDRYKSYVESRRLFREGEGGQRQYLSDQELAEARVRAKQAVDEYCS